jgi:hypothetical protein
VRQPRHPPTRRGRVATQIGIDTGRRPEDILNLRLDCLARDKDGGDVLVYDNIKANRLGRRLPISTATAAVITGQQQRIRQRFPHTPAAKLKLLPTLYRNPDGHKAISKNTLQARHRDWVADLPTLRTRDGVEFDITKIVPYAYRHTYAQRHADAGIPIDVLAELLDHRSYSVTRRYYRIGEDRRRDAVDTVTALSFDRHGNRIWRDAHALMESDRTTATRTGPVWRCGAAGIRPVRRHGPGARRVTDACTPAGRRSTNACKRVTVANAAIARELAGWCWSLAVLDD